MRSTGILLAGAASLLLLGACKPATDAQTQGPAAATVNGKVISQRTVDLILQQAAATGRPNTPEARKAVIDQLALQIVLADEAIKKGLDKSPEVVEQVEAVKQSVLANAYMQDLVKNTSIPDEALQAEYDRLKATVTGTEYRARHILVEKEAEARDIIARLKKDPSVFAKLAMEKSKDPGSKAQGGDLGWFDPRRMVPEFAAALGKLQKGKFTLEPVKSQFGYHVIALEDSRPIQAPPLAEVKPQLMQQMQQQTAMKQLETLKSGVKVEMAGASAAASPASATAPVK
ncbi:MAG: peptidylprolyl isomerase [Burkholderiales bacterium]